MRDLLAWYLVRARRFFRSNRADAICAWLLSLIVAIVLEHLVLAVALGNIPIGH